MEYGNGKGMERIHIPCGDGVVLEEHTADLWLTASGVSPEECIERTISGMYNVMAEEFNVSGGHPADLTLEAEGLEVVLVELLSELLFIFDARASLALDPKILLNEENGRVTLRMDYIETPFTMVEGKRGMEVKAATYHEASLKKDGGLWKTRVLLDL